MHQHSPEAGVCHCSATGKFTSFYICFFLKTSIALYIYIFFFTPERVLDFNKMLPLDTFENDQMLSGYLSVLSMISLRKRSA